MADINAASIHAEHVGSLLRQPWLLSARADHKAGKITEGELRATEDLAAAENIELQRSAGIQVFTDGEVRRTNWMTGILESIGGMSPVRTPGVTWHRPGGGGPAGARDRLRDDRGDVEGVPEGPPDRGRGRLHGLAGARRVQGHDDVRGDGRDDVAARGLRGGLPGPGRTGQ